MTVELFKALIDSFIALLHERKRHKLVSYEDYILPTFNAAKLVFNDYQDFYNAVEHDLESGVPLEDILRFVLTRRDLMLSERIMLRKSINPMPSEAADPFDHSVIMLVSGSHTVAHEFQHFSNDLAIHVRRTPSSTEELHVRAQLAFTAQQQAKIMEGRFESVVKAFVALRDTVAER